MLTADEIAQNQAKTTPTLTASQIANYDRDGFVVVRGALSEAELERVQQGLDRNPPLDGTLESGPTFPEPGRYTLANNCLKDPDLAFVAEHETIVGAAREVLRDDP